MAFGDTAGLLFRIRAEGGPEAAAEIEGVKTAAGGASSAFAAMGGPAGIAAVAVAAVATAAVGAASALFNLTKSSAEFGSQIFDAQAKTGLTAEALTTLKFTAEQSGTSFETVSNSVAKFNVVLGNAREGNVKAIAVLEKYHITSTDTNEAFAQAIKFISSLNSVAERNVALMELFKDRTGAMASVIQTTNGEWQKQIDLAKKLGVTLTESDIKAADEFGDTLGLLGTQAKVAGAKFSLEFAPAITKAMADISGFFARNQEAVSTWGKRVTATLAIVEQQAFQSYHALAAVAAAVTADRDAAVFHATQAWNSKPADFLPKPGDSVPPGTTGATPQDIEAQKKAADEAAKAREEAYKRDLAATSDYLATEQKITHDGFADAQAALERQFAAREIAASAFRRQSEEKFKTYSRVIKDLLQKTFDFETSPGQGKQNSEIQAMKLKLTQALENVDREVARGKADRDKAIADANKKQAEALIENEKKIADAKIKFAESAAAVLLSEYKKDLAQKKISAEQFAIFEDNLAVITLKKKRDALIDEANAIKGNRKEEIRLISEIAQVDSEITVQKNKRSENAAERANKIAKQELKDAEDLLRVQKDLLSTARQLREFEADQQRKIFKNELDHGKNRLQTLMNYEAFEKEEAQRRKDDALLEVEREHQYSLDRIAGATNEAAQKRVIDAEYALDQKAAEEKLQADLKEIRERFQNQKIAATPVGGLIGGIFGGLDSLAKQVDTFQGIGNIIGNVFGQMANAAGAAVAAFIKFGTVGGSFRKFAAEMIASIAQMAVVQAIWETAQGFAMLALAFFGHPLAGPSATAHFVAAGIYAGIAGVATVVGRGVAGNAFAQQTATGTSSRSSGTSSGQGSSNYGAYSSRPDQVVGASFSAPANRDMTLTLRLDSKGVLQLVKDSINSNGDMRGMILKVVHS